jgi:hypothetical protein
MKWTIGDVVVEAGDRQENWGDAQIDCPHCGLCYNVVEYPPMAAHYDVDFNCFECLTPLKITVNFIPVFWLEYRSEYDEK